MTERIFISSERHKKAGLYHLFRRYIFRKSTGGGGEVGGTHKQNSTSNKTQALTKSVNMDIWAIGKLNELFWRDFYTQFQFSKTRVINHKTLFLVIGPFSTHHLYNCKISTTMKLYPSFLKEIWFFRKLILYLKTHTFLQNLLKGAWELTVHFLSSWWIPLLKNYH